MRMILLAAALCVAQSLTIDLNGVSADLKEKLIRNKLAVDSVAVLRGSDWKEIAQNIGGAVKELCAALNVEVNSFAKTPVGKLTIALLVWKIVGTQVLGLGLSILLYLFVCGVLVAYIKKFHLPERITDKDGKVSYVQKFEFDGEACAWSAGGCWAVFILATISLMFAIGALV